MTIQKVSRNWGGLVVDSYIDTSTGYIEVRSQEFLGIKGDLLAVSYGRDYALQSEYLKRYNQVQTNNGKPTISKQEFDTLFYTEGTKNFNIDRAKVLNNNDNYKNIDIAEANRKNFAQTLGIPGVIDPSTGKVVAPDGKLIDPKSPPPPSPPGPDTSNTQLTPISDLNQISGRATDDTFDTLKYPKTPAVDDRFDYLKIDVIKYVPPGLGTNANFNVKRFDESGGRATDILGSVFLPMQPGITDSNGASWNEDRFNAFQAALGGTAAEALNNFGGGNIKGGVETFINNIKETAETLADSGNVQPFLTAYFAGKAVGANIIARQTGAVINNNLELLFNGPKLRTFQYNFRFTPRDDVEAREIKKIIRVFKRNLAPSQSNDGLFLASPNVFRLKYIYGNTQDQHPFLNKIGTCALTDMSVNYTPDGTYMTYGDGSMTSYTMTLQFSELNPIYREDYDTTEGKQGMGY